MGREWDAFGARRNGNADRDRDAAHRGPGRGAQPFGYSGSELPKAGDRHRFIAALTPIFAECLRVAKPGAHALVWALPRTSHWTATALEDAGWIVEDRIAHIFGQGFPKHKSKLKPAVEDWWLCTKPGGRKWLGVDACRVATGDDTSRTNNGTALGLMNDDGWQPKAGVMGGHPGGRWPTNLLMTHHPQCEPCGERRVKATRSDPNYQWGDFGKNGVYGKAEGSPTKGYADPDGLETVPAWRCVEGCPVAALDAQSGQRTSGKAGPNGHTRNQPPGNGIYGGGKGLWQDEGPAGHLYGDSGGASRFFPVFQWQAADFLYCPKAGRKERNAGLEGMPERKRSDDGYGSIQRPNLDRACPRENWTPHATANHHPTVKPLALMRWLCRLITPPGGRILDPFAGSGTTGVAALAEGFDAVLIEQDPDYHAIVTRRIDAAHQRAPLLAGVS